MGMSWNVYEHDNCLCTLWQKKVVIKIVFLVINTKGKIMENRYVTWNFLTVG